MTAFEVILDAWGELQKERPAQSGLYERRIFSKSGRSLFAGLKNPDRALQLLLYIPISDLGNWLDLETRGFDLKADRKIVVNGRVRIRLELVNPSFRDLFGRLCADAIEAILEASSDANAIAAMRARVDHWRRFIERAGSSGLSEDAQVGLYGELVFLNALLSAGYSAEHAVGAWHGPLGENHDFCFGSTAIEVKSTVANIDSLIVISNENQLDDTGLKLLGLCRVSLYRRQNLSGTLPDLVRSTISAVGPNYAPLLEDRLLSAGYHEDDAARYSVYGYAMRGVRYYSVSSGFPRIVPPDLAIGVSRVSYNVDLAVAGGFETSLEYLLKMAN
ncbi:MAG: PD-(D/E)XK motif protein [Betaproteobacteria bacterium]|jgi:hypothetical protein